jgi:hypothetical protein
MALIICMAGYNTRFHDAGFDIPKYLLPWEKDTVIHEIIKNFDYSGQKILLANKRDKYFRKNLLKTLQSLGLSEKEIFYIDDTQGQAHTAAVGVEFVKNLKEPLYIFNADTVLYGRNFTQMEQQLDSHFAYVDIFVGNSPNYGYVQGFNNLVQNIVEKKQISPFATSGLYGFKDASIYSKYYNEISALSTQSEAYVSNVLKYMLDCGCKVYMNDINPDHDIVVLGTPQEYGLEFAKKNLNIK